MLSHPFRPGVFVLLTPNTPSLGWWLRQRYPFQGRLWRRLLGLE